jgi:hypothetical protein
LKSLAFGRIRIGGHSQVIPSRITTNTSSINKPSIKRGVIPVNDSSLNQPRILQYPGLPDKFAILRLAILAAATVLTALPAFAGLGDDLTSVETDQAHMQGTLRTTQAQAYTVHEIQAPTGIVVREYVSPASGKVFGVAWQGPWPPNMRQILSNYFVQYQQAAQAQANSHAGRKPLVIQQPGLVVQAGGHMRSFAGRAYIPDMVPQGTLAEAIR